MQVLYRLLENKLMPGSYDWISVKTAHTAAACYPADTGFVHSLARGRSRIRVANSATTDLSICHDRISALVTPDGFLSPACGCAVGINV